MSRFRALAPCLLLLVMAAGCSDGESSSSTLPEGTDPVTTIATTSTSTAATTTVAPTTTTTPVPTATSTSLPPTAPPSTETPEPTSTSIQDITPPERDQLLAAMQGWYETLTSCLGAPILCDRAAVDRFGAGPLAARLLDRVDERAAGGITSVEGPQPTYYVVLDVVVGEEGSTGSVEVCLVDGAIDVRLNNIDDSTDDEIVSDAFVSGPIVYYFERTDVGWKAMRGDVGEKTEGVNTCPPPGS